MIAIEIAQPGGPEQLRAVDRPQPSPASGEVLIKVRAAGVNRPDVMQRQGKYPPPPGASDIPGLEVAGAIVALGAGVSAWREGDEVCALVAGGGYAEYCVAPAPQCLPVPHGLSLVEAAAIPETYFTVWTNVFERGRLRRGERLLVHGGTSGIGTTAIQLARARGAIVYATAGSSDKCAVCERLGAVRAIDYHLEDFVEVIRAETQGRGVDVVLDIIGGEYLMRNVNALGLEGRLVQIGTMGGTRAEINMVPVLQRRLTITGSTLRARPVPEKGAIASALRSEVWPLLEQRAVTPIVERTFPLREAAGAHRLMESSAHVGKIVLTV